MLYIYRNVLGEGGRGGLGQGFGEKEKLIQVFKFKGRECTTSIACTTHSRNKTTLQRLVRLKDTERAYEASWSRPVTSPAGNYIV